MRDDSQSIDYSGNNCLFFVSNEFKLITAANSTFADSKGGVRLCLSNYLKANNILYYKIFQRNLYDEWEPIST